ncbi:hypothetical protein F0562_019517 [Nyssa sinensis]|uniref:Uncharacterized protein n=1 Tax=Nyssa sinensis TaxID=561372 RepID=A0A5J5BPJ1_9ASTE|nr:hypothetical protein F0562_019517 [Nyssa sinensis]
MESSEEDDDFPSIESVTPQSKIDTIYQSKTEKGIRKLCFELLDLKDAVENLCGNTRTKYLAFLRALMSPRNRDFISSFQRGVPVTVVLCEEGRWCCRRTQDVTYALSLSQR